MFHSSAWPLKTEVVLLFKVSKAGAWSDLETLFILTETIFGQASKFISIGNGKHRDAI